MKHFYPWQRKNRRIFPLAVAALLFFGFNGNAQNYTVNNTADGAGVNQLRGAIQAADNLGGTHVITLSPGTYSLSLGEIVFGNKAENITINSTNGAASTIINMTTTNQDRIFLINPPGTNANITVSISGITFTGGKVNLNSPDGVPYGGGAILAGGPNNSLTVSNCVFQSNTVPASCGNGGAIEYNGGGTLSIDQSTFTNNLNQDGSGGAVYYLLENNAGVGSGSVSITNSTFSGNSVTSANAIGGAVGITTMAAAGGATFSGTVQKNNFTSNHASGTNGSGGAVAISNVFSGANTITVWYNRFFGNTSTVAPSALLMVDEPGSVDATNNWWGCNGGPTGCADKAAKSSGSAGGTLSIGSWLELKLSASPTSICPGSTSTVTASFLSNSLGSAVTASNLGALNGVAISFVSPALGTLSSPQATIQSTGTATVTYTAGSTPGTGSVNATVDNVPSTDAVAKASITVLTPGTWTGTVSSSWSTAGNWTCGVPSATTDVTISSGAPHMPVIDAAGATANNITINSGATLSFSGNNLLDVKGTISGSGTFNPANGSLKLSGTSAQTVPSGTYFDLQVLGGSAKTLSGAVTVSDVLTLTSGFVDLGSNNLTIGASGSISGGSATTYVRTAGTGKLVQNSLGATGRTGAVLYPVGTATDYTPLSIQNTGTTDNFDVRVIDNAYPTYSSDVPSGSPATTNVVKKTWFINEAVAGGSNATLTFQWNGTDEASGFIRASAYASHYNTATNKWVPYTPPAGATGSDPYTLSQSGVTSFSPFGVGSGTSILPLHLLSFSGNLINKTAQLSWTTVDEVNVKKFVLQRSIDNGVFIQVAELNARNTAGENKYAYTDATLAQLGWNNAQYRLVIVDQSGEEVQSNTLHFANKTTQAFVTVLKNPFTSQLPLNIYSPSSQRATVYLFDINGKQVVQQGVDLQTGTNTLELNTSSVRGGVYLLKVQAGDQLFSVKVVKYND